MFRETVVSLLLAAIVCLASPTVRTWAQDQGGQTVGTIPLSTDTKPVTPPVITGPEMPADAGTTRVPLSGNSSDEAIKMALGRGGESFSFDRVPLKDVIDQLASKYGIKIRLDTAALKETKTDPITKKEVTIDRTTMPITFHIKDVTLRAALSLMLAEHDLADVVRDEVLLITTKARAASMFETHLYNVRDLVVPDNDPSGGTDLDALSDAIRQTINPPSWDKAGGSGSIAPYSNNGMYALIVVQTYDGHEQIENLFAELRKLHPRAMRPPQ
jgi:hypothetical protein